MNDPAQAPVAPGAQPSTGQPVTAPSPKGQPVNGQSAWSFDPRTLAMIALASIIVLALIALAAAIDLPDADDNASLNSRGVDGSALDDRQSDSSQNGQGSAGGAEGGSSDSGGSDGGGSEGSDLDGNGRIELGNGEGLDIRPIPGCPGGFAFGDVLVVPDPEACGMSLVPDDQGRILTPNAGGNVGGFRLGPNGEIEFLAPGEVGDSDFTIQFFEDGSFGLSQGDGTSIEIIPGDDGVRVRDPVTGDSQFIPGPGAGSFALPDQDVPELQPGFELPDAEQSDDGEPNQWLVPFLVVVLVLALIALLIVGLRRTKSDTTDDESEDEPEAEEALVDYAAEISALDRMLWEIDQEPDPRTAITRVYAALETGLENPDMARRVSETPGLYLQRVLGRFDALHAPLQELTYLFEQARFSEHEITPAMRDRAVHALIAVRTHYAQAATQPAYQPEPVSQMAAP